MRLKPALLTVKDVQNFIMDAITKAPTRWYSLYDMMKILGVSEHVMKRMYSEGLPSYIYQGKKVFRAADVYKWIKEHDMHKYINKEVTLNTLKKRMEQDELEEIPD